MPYAEPPPGASPAWCVTLGPVTAGSDKVTILGKDLLPQLSDTDWYYAIIVSPCKNQAARVKVTGMVGDTLSFTWLGDSPGCFPTGSLIEYDSCSTAAVNAKVSPVARGAASPLSFDPVTSLISLDMSALKKILPGIAITADTPLQFDESSGSFSINPTAFLAIPEVKNTILGWIVGDGTYITVTSGKVALDIDAVKSAVTTTTGS